MGTALDHGRTEPANTTGVRSADEMCAMIETWRFALLKSGWSCHQLRPRVFALTGYSVFKDRRYSNGTRNSSSSSSPGSTG